ncbi:MAG: transketolase, partial [Flavobacteriales bacterium]|nr:transketolase [Flavobacteriales bacterium]
PEVLRQGTDVTVVTYGSTCHLVTDAAIQLESMGISCEVIDVQTLLPFDITHLIAESVQKTNKLLFVDEDVEGGASGFMLQQVLEKQQAFRFLDAAPHTLTGKDHRPAYASDGDYFSKPSVEDIIEAVYAIMHESQPHLYPSLI